ncbi:TPA: hypothetical protein ACSP74_003829, partial [Aeromonas veronii]
MNRILPIQGTVIGGDTQMAEANRSQQQRFEQAMRLDSEQKATDKHRTNGQSKTQEPRPQQLLQTQQQKKQAADTVRQSDIAASHSQPKHLQTQQLITRKASGLSGSALSGVAARDQREVERKKSQQTRDARDQDPEVGASAVGLPASERGFAAPLSMVNAQAPRPEKATDGSQQHSMQTTTLTSGTELPQGATQTAPQQGVASQAEESELAEPLAADTDINALTLNDEIPEASGQPIPPQVKTPGDLQLARLAPAENNRELGQLLERLAVD